MNATAKIWNGSAETDADLSVWTGSAEVAATGFGVVPYGYADYTAMLAVDPFYVAHRGGSNDWPEGSMRAYTNSVAWGARALEAPLARTSDGVWFVCHDPSINRTSGTSGQPNASSMTWAQVQTYRIVLNGGNEPYIKLTDLLEAYGSSHLLFIDPKANNYRTDELFAIVKSFPGWERHVMKYLYDGTTFAAAARTAGFRTWGFCYEADLSSLNSTQSHWDLLGMEHSASASAWNTITAVGKPVIGHIVSSSTQASSALSKGASGLMVSGVTAVIPHTGV